MDLIKTNHSRFPWRVEATAAHTLVALKGTGSKPLTITAPNGKTYAQLEHGTLTLFPGYQFDGCTCAFDFSRALPGCAAHDALLQIRAQNPAALTDLQCSRAMREMHRRYRFKLWRLYYWAVASWLGRFYRNV